MQDATTHLLQIPVLFHIFFSPLKFSSLYIIVVLFSWLWSLCCFFWLGEVELQFKNGISTNDTHELDEKSSSAFHFRVDAQHRGYQRVIFFSQLRTFQIIVDVLVLLSLPVVACAVVNAGLWIFL